MRVLSAWYDAGFTRLDQGASSGFGLPHAAVAPDAMSTIAIGTPARLTITR
jgi:hypothetical protein